MSQLLKSRQSIGTFKLSENDKIKEQIYKWMDLDLVNI